MANSKNIPTLTAYQQKFLVWQRDRRDALIAAINNSLNKAAKEDTLFTIIWQIEYLSVIFSEQ